MMAGDIFLTIIIPAYNEEKNIKGTLLEVSAYLKDRGFSYEIIVVNDGSTDGTAELVRPLAHLFANFFLLNNERNMGKGYSVKNGMLAAKGGYALFMDADNSTSIYELDKFLPYLREGYDAVIASRRIPGSMVEEPQPFLRAIMGKFYIFLSGKLLKLGVNDFNCGFKVYNMKRSRFIFDMQRMHDWSFDAELLFLATKYGLKIKEAPVRWVHKSTSKVKPIRDGIKSFISLVRIRMNDIEGRYKR